MPKMRQMLVGVAVVALVGPLAAHAETVTVSGAQLQVTVKKTRPNQVDATLDQDATVTVEDQQLPLKAGKPVSWWTNGMTLAKGTLKAPVTVQIGGKAWNLAGDSEVTTAFMSGKTYLQTVELVGTHAIEAKGVTFTAGPGTAQFGATADRMLHNFRSVQAELTTGGAHVTLPAGTYVGLNDTVENQQKAQFLWSIQATASSVPSIDLWGKSFPVQVISLARDGSGRLERVKLRSAMHEVAGQTLKLGEVRFNAQGEPETVELAGKQKVMVDGAEDEAFNGKYFVSSDLKLISKTKDGLAKLVGPAPAAAPAATAAPALAPAPVAAPTAPVAPAPPPGRPGANKKVRFGGKR